jgi:hypothetical protein
LHNYFIYYITHIPRVHTLLTAAASRDNRFFKLGIAIGVHHKHNFFLLHNIFL